MYNLRKHNKLCNVKANQITFGYIYIGYQKRYLIGEFTKLFTRYILVITYEIMVKQKRLREIFAGTVFFLLSFWFYHAKVYKNDNKENRYGLRMKKLWKYDCLANFVIFLNIYASLI